MKKVAILVMLAMVMAVPAYAQLGDTDNSSFTIQNLGTTTATITVTFYNESGTPFTPDPLRNDPTVPNPFTLASGAKQEVHMPSIPNFADGRYSVVIESTEPIAVIANLIGKTGGGAPFYNGSYSGFDMGNTEIYFPATHREYYNWNSLMSVQNTTANPISVDIRIYNEAGAQVATKTYASVPAFSAAHLDLETEGAGLGLPSGFNGSAKAICSGACVGTDNQTADGGYTQSYNAFLAGGDKLYAPALYNNYFTWNGSMKVQNIGSAATSVNVAYYVQGGDVCNAPAATVQPNQALFHHLPSQWSSWGCGAIDTQNKTISAVVTSGGQDIVGIINAANPGKQAQTYGLVPASEGATAVGLPAIMNDYYGWNTSFTCQNVSSSGTANVTYSYSPGGCPSGSCSFSLAAGAAKEIFQPGDLGATKGLFAASVQATGANIACIVNETLPGPKRPGAGDWSMSYNGFSQ